MTPQPHPAADPPQPQDPDEAFPLDAGDLGCAQLLILLRKSAAGLPDGTIIHLTTSDPIAGIDLPAWCRMTHHEYLGPLHASQRPTYAIKITATPTPTDQIRPWRQLPGDR